MSKQPCVWVVEVWWNSMWLPSAEVANTRSGALRLAKWELADAYPKIRAAKYVRVEPKKGRK